MINNALKMIRLYHNLKQTELAERFCISKSYLSEIESGKKDVTFSILEKYATEFNIPASLLLFFSEEMNSDIKNITLADKFKTAFSEKIIKLMEWVIEKNEKEKVKNKG